MSVKIQQGYWIYFNNTGVDCIDEILSAIGHAGKAYHNTEGWNESTSYANEDGPTHVDLIQDAANKAALAFREKP